MTRDYHLIAVILGCISVATCLDIILDMLDGVTLSHVAVEIFILIVSIAGILVVLGKYSSMKHENIKLQQDLVKTEQDMAAWRDDAQKYLQGLGDAIDRQMTRWAFTPAEKEVGLLLLKGLSFKEIASVRNTSERTARQQSLVIYKKSGMAGRAEFSAFFLEDLLAPRHG